MKNNKVLFLTLRTFSLTGGIEKVSKTFAKALHDLKHSQLITSYQVLSMYDDQADPKYIPNDRFKGYKGNRLAFGLAAVNKGLKANLLIVSHVHLLLFASIIKKLKPSIRIVLFAHGIEIWNALPNWKKQLLNKIEIWAVSRYTANEIVKQHSTKQNQIKVLNNSLDPFFELTEVATKPVMLLKKYGINSNQKVLLSICRLSWAEQYKGYDVVIKCLKEVIKTHPNLIYLLVGNADQEELNRINNLVESLNLQQNIILTGFVPDDEINLHYQLADVFVMPSKAEGFGLVFIEAAAHGCAVIAGNADGSRDALLNGDIGQLVHPLDETIITVSILTALQTGKQDAIQTKCIETFSYETYKKKVIGLIN